MTERIATTRRMGRRAEAEDQRAMLMFRNQPAPQFPVANGMCRAAEAGCPIARGCMGAIRLLVPGSHTAALTRWESGIVSSIISIHANINIPSI